MTASTYIPAGDTARRELRSAWANAIGSTAVLVSVAAAAWWVSLPVLGVDGPVRVVLTVLAALYTASAAALKLRGVARGGLHFAAAILASAVLADITGHFPVVLGLAVAMVCVFLFANRLDLAQTRAEGGVAS